MIKHLSHTFAPGVTSEHTENTMEPLNGVFKIPASRSDRLLKPFPWTRLPAELRLTILDDFTARWPLCTNRWTYAHLATVCKEWQVYFEKITFHLVRLDLSSLDDFKAIAEHRQHLIHHIQFCVRPDIGPLLSNLSWGPRMETSWDNPQRSVQKFVMLKEQIRKLLAILKTWPQPKNWFWSSRRTSSL